MQLFLMRHGEASFEAPSDRERMLTDAGRLHTTQMSNWLNDSVSAFDLVLVSPYLRAQQTWQELGKHFPEPRKWMVLDELVPSADPEMAASLVKAYAEQFKADKVLVIAHMPLLVIWSVNWWPALSRRYLRPRQWHLLMYMVSRQA